MKKILPHTIPDTKMTPQRIAILKYLEGNTSHPSAQDIYAAVSQQFPTMSFSTVYNTLEKLKSTGLVRDLSIDYEKKRFDPDMKPHHHLICMKCKTILDVYVDFDLTLPPESLHGFTVAGNHVDFFGICPACSAERSFSVKETGSQK